MRIQITSSFHKINFNYVLIWYVPQILAIVFPFRTFVLNVHIHFQSSYFVAQLAYLTLIDLITLQV
jgi:hypothetical protein